MPNTRTPNPGLVRGLGLPGDQTPDQIDAEVNRWHVRISNLKFPDVRTVPWLALLFCMGLNWLREQDRRKKLRITSQTLFVDLKTATQDLFTPVVESYGINPQHLRGKINHAANSDGWIYLGFTEQVETEQIKFDAPIVRNVKICNPIVGRMAEVPVHALLIELGMILLEEKSRADEIFVTLDEELTDFEIVRDTMLGFALEGVFQFDNYWTQWYSPIREVVHSDEMLAIDDSDKWIDVNDVL